MLRVLSSIPSVMEPVIKYVTSINIYLLKRENSVAFNAMLYSNFFLLSFCVLVIVGSLSHTWQGLFLDQCLGDHVRLGIGTSVT